jgi:hypothetical protein
LSTTNRRRRPAASQVIQTVEDLVRTQVPSNRREEIERYLRLFGYNPDHSILQVHVAGYFGRGRIAPKERENREQTAARYKGRTFTVVGTSHDPNLAARLVAPKKKTEESSPGYLGYLFKPRNKNDLAPHELLPLDFTPSSLNYPSDWKAMYGTRGYLIAMHVPSDFAARKNNLLREIRRNKGNTNVKEPWSFLDKVENYGADTNSAEN